MDHFSKLKKIKCSTGVQIFVQKVLCFCRMISLKWKIPGGRTVEPMDRNIWRTYIFKR